MSPRATRRAVIAAVLAAAASWSLPGCAKPVSFPSESMPAAAKAAGALLAYDARLRGKADFFLYADASGRVNAIGYDNDGDQKPDVSVNLDAIAFWQCRHLVLILDGFAYDLIKAYYDEGHLRMFHPPSRVISPYPSMTDLALEDVLDYMPCRGFEALYYDRKANKLTGGSLAYLAGTNEPYNRLLHYRANLFWDAIGYVAPWQVFGKEVNDAKRTFDKARSQEMLAYFVSSAGMGTTQGAQGQRKCLGKIEQLVHQVLYETHALAKITLLADHGHSYTPSKRIPLEDYLKRKGWRLGSSLRDPRDVVYVRFGLVTYASFSTLRPADLAADLAACEGVELASYAEKDTVVVLAPGKGRAVVRRRSGRYAYEALAGDPLKLKDILTEVPSDGEGYRDSDALLRATAAHVYPDPLVRLWQAHFGLVENPPDVIVSLSDRFYSGSSLFAGAVDIASTHGGLNYRNSVTFIMSTAAPLPPLMRSCDVPGYMRQHVVGGPWPMRK